MTVIKSKVVSDKYRILTWYPDFELSTLSEPSLDDTLSSPVESWTLRPVKVCRFVSFLNNDLPITLYSSVICWIKTIKMVLTSFVHGWCIELKVDKKISDLWLMFTIKQIQSQYQVSKLLMIFCKKMWKRERHRGERENERKV